MAEAITQIVQHAVELSIEQPFYIPMTGPATTKVRSFSLTVPNRLPSDQKSMPLTLPKVNQHDRW